MAKARKSSELADERQHLLIAPPLTTPPILRSEAMGDASKDAAEAPMSQHFVPESPPPIITEPSHHTRQTRRVFSLILQHSTPYPSISPIPPKRPTIPTHCLSAKTDSPLPLSSFSHHQSILGSHQLHVPFLTRSTSPANQASQT
ncbi:hypothetical protein HGRIS_003293 [Hohenbuehelia grisea]|uniref:Uncharacterized protein n=1 Tax=Hohenbuehelia grisea TaxID=104357 RepID=A0ABR3JFF2_9AGAR